MNREGYRCGFSRTILLPEEQQQPGKDNGAERKEADQFDGRRPDPERLFPIKREYRKQQGKSIERRERGQREQWRQRLSSVTWFVALTGPENRL